MEQPKYTPGPLVNVVADVMNQLESFYGVDIADFGSMVCDEIAESLTKKYPTEAAAPELLAELEAAHGLISRLNTAFYGSGKASALRPVMAETKPRLEAIRAAIAKATGQTS